MKVCNLCHGRGWIESNCGRFLHQCCDIFLYTEEVRRRYARSWDGGRVLHPPVGSRAAMCWMREGEKDGDGGQGPASQGDFSRLVFPIWAILAGGGAVELAAPGIGTGRQIL